MKIILVPLSKVEGGEALLDTAFRVAAHFNSHVEVLHVRPDPSEALHITGMAFPGALRASVLEVGQRHAEETAVEVRALFHSYCEAKGITILESPPLIDSVSTAWREVTGKESLVLALHGRLSDLTVVGRPVGETPIPTALEVALMETGKPVLVMPAGESPAFGRKVVIAWNGSTVAAKAVAAARHFLLAAESVTILALREDRAGSIPAAELVEHLAWHDVEAGVATFETGLADIGQRILDETVKLGGDLLVLGGYGTSLTREMLLGGVTRHMLIHARVPLLMVH